MMTKIGFPATADQYPPPVKTTCHFIAKNTQQYGGQHRLDHSIHIKARCEGRQSPYLASHDASAFADLTSVLSLIRNEFITREIVLKLFVRFSVSLQLDSFRCKLYLSDLNR